VNNDSPARISLHRRAGHGKSGEEQRHDPFLEALSESNWFHRRRGGEEVRHSVI
jgi:hypothetical protein